MYKVIVGFNFSSLTITVELTIKALGCNVIMKPLECGKHFTIRSMYVGASAGSLL